MAMGGSHGSGDARQQRDSQPDSGASTFSEGSMMVASIIEADNSQLIKDSESDNSNVSKYGTQDFVADYNISIFALGYLTYSAPRP